MMKNTITLIELPRRHSNINGGILKN